MSLMNDMAYTYMFQNSRGFTVSKLVLSAALNS